MKNLHALLILGFTLTPFIQAVADTKNRTANISAIASTIDSSQLFFQVYDNKTKAKQIIPHDNQAASDESEDGEPSGPDENAPPIYLADYFVGKSTSIGDDFEYHIPYSQKLIRDNSSLNTYYFYPSAYFLKYDYRDGFSLDFLHRTKESDSEKELIIMTFTIAPRKTTGGLNLLKALAINSTAPANNKDADVQRLPIESARVVMHSLTSMISEENLKIINSPQDVGDEIRVQASMTQSEKEDVVASIRSGGLSGDLIFTTNEGKFEIIIPYYVNLADFSGDWLSEVRGFSESKPLVNLSPFPLIMKGVVAYTSKNKKLQRHFISLKRPVLMPPRARGIPNISYKKALRGKGEILATWAAYEKVKCAPCLNKIEQAVLVAPSVASRANLAIEAIPNIFSDFSLFKVLIEVRSTNFSSGRSVEEIKTATLRPDQSQAKMTLYIDRDANTKRIYEYRIKPYHSEGEHLKKSKWIAADGALDITISKRDIQKLVSSEN